MRKIIYLFLVLISINLSFATTYYMANESCNNSWSGNETHPVCELRTAFTLMNGGDTLIIEDGVYTGEENTIDSWHYPPAGSPGNFTTIKAENKGKVLFDGENKYATFYLDGNTAGNINYLKFEGLEWGRSTSNVVGINGREWNYSKYIYFKNCGFFDSKTNATNMGSGLLLRYIDHALIEDCYVYGGFYYGIFILQDSSSIIRRTVVRYDVYKGPIGGAIGIYTSKDIKVQNSIVIDSDNGQFYNITGTLHGFAFPTTNGPSYNVDLEGCFILNLHSINQSHPIISGLVSQNSFSYNFTFTNNVFWDTMGGFWDRGAQYVNGGINLSHCIFGNNLGYGVSEGFVGGLSVYDTIFLNNSVYGFGNNYPIDQDYNLLYLNGINYRSSSKRGPHDYSLENGNEINPFTNSLKYLPRIEDGSDLSGKASDGGDIGATILYKIGRDGSFYGEPGWNETTNESLWPFPNEDIVKEHFGAYNYSDGLNKVNGSRGFAANGTGLYGGPITLTSYIWEYLGNPCPDDVCNYDSPKTYYMANESCSDSNPGTESQPVCDLETAFSLMKGGDTLIIEDGIYTGAENMIDLNNVPPKGSKNDWTMIKARNSGKVIFDGQNVNNMFIYSVNNGELYWIFNGIIWGRNPGSNVQINGYNSYVKFLNCGAFDSGDGNTANFAIFRHASYILLENCYAWGSGRYKFLSYQNSNVIFRNCVARSDRINASTEPMAQYSLYSCSNVLVENCIAIDSDQTNFYSASEYHGPFIVPSTDMNAYNTTFVNSIGLNIKTGGICTTGSDYRQSYDTKYENCVLWDCGSNYGNSINWIRGFNTSLNHVTHGVSLLTGNIYNVAYTYSYSEIGNLNTEITNSIFYNISDSSHALIKQYGVSGIYDYNAYYDNSAYLPAYANGVHDIFENFLWSNDNQIGSLKFIPRIESGSVLSGRASDGGDVGANVIYQFGKSGTLWGEEGFDKLQDGTNGQGVVVLWPFPNEDIIKEHFSSYYYTNGTDEIRGDRGFAANGNGLYGGPITLTSYIWEYLGNPCPEDICNYTVPHTFHKADLDHSGVIEDSETKSFWQRWMSNLESFSDMFDVLRVWKSG